MTVRVTFSGSRQIIEEYCEHCDEFVRELHISDIAVVPENDPRTVKIRDKNNNIKTLKKGRERVVEVSESFKRKGLLDDTEAQEAFTKRKFKYGARPEAMCSESIDSVLGITASYCYKTTNPKFLRKQKADGTTFSASFYAPSQFKGNSTGSKVGMDRKGNIIRLKEIKFLDLDTGRVKLEDDGRTEKKKFIDGWDQEWFRRLTDERQKYYFEIVVNCEAFITKHGKDEVYSGKAFTRFRNEDELRTEIVELDCPR